VDSPLARKIIPKASENLIHTLEEDFKNLNNLESDINITNNQITDEIKKIASSDKFNAGKKIEKILELVSSIKSLINQENKIVNMKRNLLQKIFSENAKNAENIQFFKSQIAQNLDETNKEEKNAFNVNAVLDIITRLKGQINLAPAKSNANNNENTNKISNQNSPLVNNYILINKSDIDSAFGEEDYPVEYEEYEENEEDPQKKNNRNHKKIVKANAKEIEEKSKKTKSAAKKSKNEKFKEEEKSKKQKAIKISGEKIEKKVIKGKTNNKKTNSTYIEVEAKEEKNKGTNKKNKKKGVNKAEKEKKKPESNKDKKENSKKHTKKNDKKSKVKENNFNSANNKNITNTNSTLLNKEKSEIKDENFYKIPSVTEKPKLEIKTQSVSDSENSNNKNSTEEANPASASNKTINKNSENKNSTKTNSSMSIPVFLESRSHKMKARKFKTKKPYIELQTAEALNHILNNSQEISENKSKSVSKILLDLKRKMKQLVFSLPVDANEVEINDLFDKTKTLILNSNLFSSADALAFQSILDKEDFEISDVDILKKKNFKLNNFIEIISDFYKHLTKSVAKIENEFTKQKTLNKITRNIDVLHQLKSLSIMFMRSLHILNKNVLSKKENEDYLKKLTQKLLDIKSVLKDYFQKDNGKQKPEDSDFKLIKEYKEKMNNYLDLYRSIKIRNNNIAGSNSIMRKIIETNSNILKEDTFVKILEMN